MGTNTGWQFKLFIFFMASFFFVFKRYQPAGSRGMLLQQVVSRPLAVSAAVLMCLLLGSAATTAHAQVTFSDPGFATETVVKLPVFTPVGLTFAPGSMFIWQKQGVVRIFKNGTLLPASFIDISSQVNQCGDQGLVGLALDPNFSTNGYVYLLYTVEAGGNPSDCGAKTARLSRVTANPSNPDVALSGSEVFIL